MPSLSKFIAEPRTAAVSQRCHREPVLIQEYLSRLWRVFSGMSQTPAIRAVINAIIATLFIVVAECVNLVINYPLDPLMPV